MNYRFSNNGISPTVGVTLMVAITVVLAVTVGAMVLDIGEETSQNAQAGVTMQETNNGVEVKVNSFGGNTDELEVLVNGSVQETVTSVGTYTVTAGEDDVVSVRGTTESGEESVIQSTTIESGSSGGDGGSESVSSPNPNSPDDLSSIHSNMDGKGTSEDPYVVMDSHDLQAMNENPAASYVLGQNIDASKTSGWNSDSGFKPIGKWGNEFTGSLDGNGYEVSGLTVNRSDNTIGLIGVMVSSGSVSNVGVVEANMTGNNHVGGLVGENRGSVSGSYATGEVTGMTNGDEGNRVGGLVGSNRGSVSSSYATGEVTGGRTNVGGLVGQNYDGGSVSGSYATGSVTGGRDVGGLVGGNDGGSDDGGSVSSSYATGSVTGSVEYTTSGEDVENVGGLVGQNGNSDVGGSVSESYATGSVTGSGDSYVGGLVGRNSEVSEVKKSYWDTERDSSDGSATGLTTSQMTGSNAETNMNAFDFDTVWQTVDGDYPELQWQEDSE